MAMVAMEVAWRWSKCVSMGADDIVVESSLQHHWFCGQRNCRCVGSYTKVYHKLTPNVTPRLKSVLNMAIFRKEEGWGKCLG